MFAVICTLELEFWKSWQLFGIFQKLAKSEEEDVVGTYFKPIRASRLVAQAQETKRGKTFILLILGITQSCVHLLSFLVDYSLDESKFFKLWWISLGISCDKTPTSQG